MVVVHIIITSCPIIFPVKPKVFPDTWDCPGMSLVRITDCLAWFLQSKLGLGVLYGKGRTRIILGLRLGNIVGHGVEVF